MISAQVINSSGIRRAVEHQPVRVLHIVENLDEQAVENWLLRVLSIAVREQPHFQWTLFCTVGRPGRLDAVAQQLGITVIHSRAGIDEKIRFIRELRNVMKQGRYDILHCHHDVMSAAYLTASAGLPFKKRIVHVHNTSMTLPTPNRLKSELVREPMRQVCLRMADTIVGISDDALQSMLGSGDVDPKRHRVVHYAVDTEKFALQPERRREFRETLDLPLEAKIMLFVGRLTDYKNPSFVVDVLAELVNIDPAFVAVFAGNGPEEQKVRELANASSLAERIRLIGFREDVPNLMVNSDVLIWPSIEQPKEGLGLGIVEAQAAGLPIVMSRSVPEEAIVVPELIAVLPLSAGAREWAKSIESIISRPRPDRETSRARLAASSFSLASGLENIMKLYVSEN